MPKHGRICAFYDIFLLKCSIVGMGWDLIVCEWVELITLDWTFAWGPFIGSMLGLVHSYFIVSLKTEVSFHHQFFYDNTQMTFPCGHFSYWKVVKHKQTDNKDWISVLNNQELWKREIIIRPVVIMTKADILYKCLLVHKSPKKALILCIFFTFWENWQRLGSLSALKCWRKLCCRNIVICLVKNSNRWSMVRLLVLKCSIVCIKDESFVLSSVTHTHTVYLCPSSDLDLFNVVKH